MPQEASQRSLERCSEAEAEVETLRSRLAELEGRDSGRGSVVALEIKVDELEEVIVIVVLLFCGRYCCCVNSCAKQHSSVFNLVALFTHAVVLFNGC